MAAVVPAPMPFSTRSIQLLFCTVASATAVLSCASPAAAMPAPPEPAYAVAAPTDIAVHFTDSTATITWNEVPASRGYGVTIRPLDVQGPYGEEQVIANNYTLPFTQFPGYGKYKDGYAYQVCSFGSTGRGPCTTLSDGFAVRSAGHAVSTDNLHRAAHKVSSCLGNGEKAGLLTAAGGGIVAALDSWIPGVDVVTAAGVGIAASGEGAQTFVSCLLNW
ncbi:MAG TPA: hypothetical protein VG650_15695 [Mycobacteriales bacterium]|nr:hypothetical protein [Mycobacteriales bacterium]